MTRYPVWVGTKDSIQKIVHVVPSLQNIEISTSAANFLKHIENRDIKFSTKAETENIELTTLRN